MANDSRLFLLCDNHTIVTKEKHMSDSTPKTPDTKLTKDYGEFGKLEVIDLADEVANYDVLGLYSSRD